MSFWNTDNPLKPTGIKDPDAILDYPIDFSGWLLDISDTYLSHEVITSEGITCITSNEVAGVISPFITGGMLGTTEWFTIRISTVGGRTDDRTFYLKIKER